MGFWRKPREERWRGWALQIHLWTGLVIGVWAVLIGLSGSALVFKEEIELALEPEVFSVEPQPGRASLDTVLAEARRRFPKHQMGGFIGLDREHESPYLWVTHLDENGDLTNRYNIHFNQYTGEILGEKKRYTGVLGFLEDFHFFLLLGRKGIQVNAVFGFGLLAMCLTGLVIWWPGVAKWKEAARVKWGARWKRVNFDLHRALGFYTVGLLTLMAVTGSYFGLPQVLLGALTAATGASVEEVQAARKFPKSAVVEAGSAFSTQAVYERGEALLPPGFVVDGIILPRAPEAVFNVRGKRPGNPLLASYAGSYFDQYTGELLGTVDSRKQPLALQAVALVGPVHFGTWGGVWSKLLWLMLGLAPGTLFLTGFAMWWNRMPRKRRSRASSSIQVVSTPRSADAQRSR